MLTPEPDPKLEFCNDCQIVKETGLDYPGHTCPYPEAWAAFLRKNLLEKPDAVSSINEDSRTANLECHQKSTRNKFDVMGKPSNSSRSKVSTQNGLTNATVSNSLPDTIITRSGRKVRLTKAAIEYRAACHNNKKRRSV
ncbi:MAG: hypothetical protein NXY57DRAFT_1044687 [Lentinula lateritia]|nr:MAG: hypothetical protein NXY57DRAFT_1044687 [Lentinula lateritia]